MTKPKKLNFNGAKYNNWLTKEKKLIAKIDNKRGKKENAERDIMEYPTTITNNGERVWSF